MRAPFERAARNVTIADDLQKLIESAENDLPYYAGHPHEFQQVTIALSHLKAAQARFNLAAKEAYREGDRCERVGQR